MAKRRFTAMLAALALAAAGAAVLVPATTAGATDVGDEAAFRLAFANDTQVDLTADITLTCPGGTAFRTGTNGAVTVNGHGFTIRQTCLDDNSVLEVEGESGDSLTLVDVTIAGGFTDHGGAGVFMDGSGNLTIVDSTVTENNVCEGDGGGGVQMESDGLLTILRSTFTGNHADDIGGAALVAGDGNLAVLNSTITGNSSNGEGGALATSGEGDATIAYSTITSNSISPVECPFNDGALDAGGVDPKAPDGDVAPTEGEVAPAQTLAANLHINGTLEIFGTVVAQPIGAPNCDTLTVVSDGYNWTDDDPAAGITCGFTGTGDTQSNGASPGLGALAGNGGPTATLLPVTGSPLLDAIPLAACQTAPLATGVDNDQRSLPRPGISTPGCDIGAVEVQGLAIAPRFTG